MESKQRREILSRNALFPGEEWYLQFFWANCYSPTTWLAPCPPWIRKLFYELYRGVTLRRKYRRPSHNYSALCCLLFVSPSMPTLNFKCECDYRVAFIFNGLASMCFRMQQTPANGWLRIFSADGTYISHIYTSTAYSSSFFLLLLLLFHSPSSPCLYHSRGRRWAKEIEGETVPSVQYPNLSLGTRGSTSLESKPAINPFFFLNIMLWLISLLYKIQINALCYV